MVLRMSSHGLATAREQGFADLLGRVDVGVTNAADALSRLQQPDGHWAFELEADATIPAEYILLRHFLGEPDDPVLEGKIVRYLWSIQGEHGGWPLFHGGDFNMSASVKAYYALKICGEHVNAPVMKRAREAILSRGGAKESNVFTLVQLALFGQVPWRAVPVMPVEIMALPRWFPFHLDKVSYWSRTVIVPLLVLMAKKPLARNPRKIDVRELFVTPPEQVTDWYNYNRKGAWASFFRGVDRVLQRAQALFPKRVRERCIADALKWVGTRLNGEDGLGAIYPAMANSVMMYDTLGYPEDHPERATARGSLEKLMVLKDGMAYCQPCLSPVWDTALAAHAMLEAGGDAGERVKPAMDWLKDRQILDVYGDWAVNCPGVRPGGWAFQYNNAYYPDVDDTAVVALAMDRTDRERYRESIDRATEWIFGVQSKNGGWGAFDANNEYYYLNHIPFAEHGALPLHAGAARLPAGSSEGKGRGRLSDQRPGSGWLLVRALGHQLHLRHLVGAVRAERRRRARRSSGDAQGHDLAQIQAARRWRLGRRRRVLLGRQAARRGQGIHALADCLGRAGPDGGRRGGWSGGGAGHAVPDRHPDR